MNHLFLISRTRCNHGVVNLLKIFNSLIMNYQYKFWEKGRIAFFNIFRIQTTFVLLFGGVNCLFSQESFFSPIDVNKNTTSTFKHDYISVVHGPGQIRFQKDLGPGVASRGISFQPSVAVQSAQKIDAIPGAGGSWISEFYMGTGQWVARGGVSDSDALYTLWYNSSGASFQTPPMTNGTNGSYRSVEFFQSLSSDMGLSAGYLFQNKLSTNDINLKLPGGRRLRVLADVNELKELAQSFDPMLNRFGYNASNVSGGYVIKTDQNGLLFPLYGSNGQDIQVGPPTVQSLIIPAKFLLVIDNIGYEYSYSNFTSAHIPDQYDGDGNIIQSGYYIIGTTNYRITKIINKFNDTIIFSHLGETGGYQAELWVDGNSSGMKVIVSVENVPSIGNIPSLNAAYAYSGYDMVPVDKLISISTVNGAEIVSSYKIWGAIATNWNTFATERQVTPNLGLLNLIQPVRIIEAQTEFRIDLNYKWATDWLPYGEGRNVGSVVIDNININSVLEYQFQYQSNYYHQWDSDPADWEALAWGVSQMNVKDIVTDVIKITKYSRKVPLALDPSNHFAFLSNVTWFNKKSYESEEHPDGRLTVRYFVSPNTLSGGANSTLGLSEKDFATFSLYYTGQVCEERDYASLSDWLNEPNSSAIGIKTFDEWSANRHSTKPERPFAIVTSSAGTGRTPSVIGYPTRVTTWSKADNIAKVRRYYNWDSQAAQWKDLREYTFAVDGDLIPMLGINPYKWCDSATESGNTFPAIAGMVERIESTYFKQLNENFNFGDWTKREFFQNGIPRLPTIYRTSSDTNGVTLSEEIRGLDGSYTRKNLSYSTDSTPLPSIISLVSDAGSTLDGQVGVNLGYDSIYRLNSVQKIGAQYLSRRELNADHTVRSITDINGFKYSYQWDSLGRIKGSFPPSPELGSNIEYYDSSLSQTLFRGSQEFSLYFNAFGELIRNTRKDGLRNSSHKRTGYDTAGRKIWESGWINGEGSNQGWNQPLSSSGTQWAYDEWDRVTRIVDPNGTRKDFSYQGLNKTVTIASGTALAASTIYVSDVLGRLVKVVDPVNQVTTYEYDSADRLVSVRQYPTSTGTGANTVGTGLPQIRSWVYDNLGRLTILEQPESGVTYFALYDVFGNSRKIVYGLPHGWRPGSVSNLDVSAFSIVSAKLITREYDTLGRPVTVISSDGSVNQTFSYDEVNRGASNGKLTTALSDGITRALGYGGLNGRLSDQQLYIPGLQPYTQGLGYDNYGNLVSRIYPENRRQSIPYDGARGVPTGVTYNESGLVTIAYDPTHWGLSGITYSNGASTFFHYDPDQIRLHKLTHTIGTSTLRGWTYAYDLRGRLETDTEDWFWYDPSDRLSVVLSRNIDSVTGQTSGSPYAIWQSFSYDAFGNRTNLDSKAVINWPIGTEPPMTLSKTPTSKASTYSLNSNDLSLSQHNQLPQFTATGVLTGANYDPQGNMTRIYGKPGDSSTQVSLTYDALGQVKTMADSQRNIVEVYSYDDRGLRVIVEVYQGTIAPSNLLKRQYRIYNEARQLVSEYESVLE